MDLVNFLIDLVLASLSLSFSILFSSIITDNFRAAFFPRKTFPSAIPLFQSFFLLPLFSSLFLLFSLLYSSPSHFIFTPLELFPTFILLFIQTFYHCLPRAFLAFSLPLLPLDIFRRKRGATNLNQIRRENN